MPGDTELITACRRKDTNGAKKAIDQNRRDRKYINSRNKDGETALSIAVRCGHYDVVCLLLDNKVKQSVMVKNKDNSIATDCYPIMLSTDDRITQLMYQHASFKVLIHNAFDAPTPNLDAIKFFMDKNILGELHINPFLAYPFSYNNNPELLKLLLENRTMVELLAERDNKGDSALTYAGNIEVLYKMLEAAESFGFKFEEQEVEKAEDKQFKLAPESKPPEKKSVRFSSPNTISFFDEEAYYDDETYIKKYKHELNTPYDTGDTPFTIACKIGNIPLAEKIIHAFTATNGDCNSLINHQNNNGQTPLIIAVENGNVDLVRMLLEHGANPLDQVENTSGTQKAVTSPILIACQKGYNTIVDLLLQDQNGSRLIQLLIATQNTATLRLLFEQRMNQKGMGQVLEKYLPKIYGLSADEGARVIKFLFNKSDIFDPRNLAKNLRHSNFG
jgi:ankyrin repeat protein